MAVGNSTEPSMTLEEGEELESFGIVNASVIIVIAVVVNVTNFCTLLVVRSYKYVFNPNILIGGVALVHYVSTFSLSPLIAYTYLASGPVPTVVCDVFDALWTFYQLLSTSIMTLKVLDRYMAIRKPILYRTRLSGAFIKYVMVCALLTSIPLSFTPIVVKIIADDTTEQEFEREISRTKYYCIGLHNQYYRVHKILILVINCTLFFVGLFCYVSFLLGVRNFVNRWLIRFSNQNSSLDLSDVDKSLCCCCRCGTKQPQKSLSKEELVERTLQLMKSLHVKRCTRISKTIAVAAGLYYIPWLFSQASIFYELLTGNYLPILDYIIIRVVLASSILNPLVYVTFSKSYRYGYHRVLTKPLHVCGYEWQSRKPLGLSASEMQRISHRMALDEWESPGLVRRQYSKRRTKKKISRRHHVYTVSGETGNSLNGHDRQAAMKERRYRKKMSMDASTGRGMAKYASDTKARSRRNTVHDSCMHARIDPSSSEQRSNSIGGVDPYISSLGLSESVNGSAIRRHKSMSQDSWSQTIQEEWQIGMDMHSIKSLDESSIIVNSLDSHSQSNGLLRGPQSLQELAATAVDSARCPDHKRTCNGVPQVQVVTGDSMVSSRRASNESVLKPQPDANGHVCIHLDVIEFVNRHEMVHQDGSLVSTNRKCKLRGQSPKTPDDLPSFVFSLRQNRFVPERIHQDHVDTYSYQHGKDSVLQSIPAHLLTTPESSSISPVVSSLGDIPDLPVSETFGTNGPRVKKTSEALRESSRYRDDIIMLNNLILQDQLEV